MWTVTRSERPRRDDSTLEGLSKSLPAGRQGGRMQLSLRLRKPDPASDTAERAGRVVPVFLCWIIEDNVVGSSMYPCQLYLS
jgi:hypothetical protein